MTWDVDSTESAVPSVDELAVEHAASPLATTNSTTARGLNRKREDTASPLIDDGARQDHRNNHEHAQPSKVTSLSLAKLDAGRHAAHDGLPPGIWGTVRPACFATRSIRTTGHAASLEPSAWVAEYRVGSDDATFSRLPHRCLRTRRTRHRRHVELQLASRLAAVPRAAPPIRRRRSGPRTTGPVIRSIGARRHGRAARKSGRGRYRTTGPHRRDSPR